MNCPDTFNGPVYCGPGLFLTLDPGADAEEGDYVATEQYEDGKIQVERFDGQDYFGVVTVLEFWKFEHSEQWTPKRHRMLN